MSLWYFNSKIGIFSNCTRLLVGYLFLVIIMNIADIVKRNEVDIGSRIRKENQSSKDYNHMLNLGGGNTFSMSKVDSLWI